MKYNKVAEESVLGAILIDKSALEDVIDILLPKHFYHNKLGTIYQAMLDLYHEDEPVDIVTVCAELKKKNKLKLVGGVSRVSDLLNVVPTSAHTNIYGDLILKCFVERR